MLAPCRDTLQHPSVYNPKTAPLFSIISPDAPSFLNVEARRRPASDPETLISEPQHLTLGIGFCHENYVVLTKGTSPTAGKSERIYAEMPAISRKCLNGKNLDSFSSQ
jgi:hypothetical protein